MNKKELLQAISIESGLSLKDSKTFLKAFTNVIVEDVKTGGKTSIPKFGSFFCRHKGARPGRNLHTGAPMIIDETNVLIFKPADNIKKILNSDK